MKLACYLAIILGAYLLFVVQPMLAKSLLPLAGGSGAVWATTLVFSQSLLLLGYAYAHFSARLLNKRQQTLLQVGLLALAVLSLPTALRYPSNEIGVAPFQDVFTVLSRTIALPYVLLCTTTPLIQRWLSDDRKQIPLGLFAMSNAASLLGLLAYPFLIEPKLGLSTQYAYWNALFLIYAICFGVIAIRFAASPNSTRLAHRVAPGEQIPFGAVAKWILLPMCSTALMMATSGFMTTQVAPLPLLWVAPLAVYLFSFVVAFSRFQWYRSWIGIPTVLAATAMMLWLFSERIDTWSLVALLGLLGGSLFAACLMIHAELASRAPEASHLTLYYLAIATGGAIAGVAVALLAPILLNYDYDLLLAAAGASVIFCFIASKKTTHVVKSERLNTLIGLLALLVNAFFIYGVFNEIGEMRGKARYLARNFYGSLEVRNDKEGGTPVRMLVHGTITHGTQILAAESAMTPTTYYSEESGVGRAFAVVQKKPQVRIGTVGLGAGTVAAYGKIEDSFRFYEINPLIIEIAKKEFSYLSRSTSDIKIVLGDARLSLAKEPNQQFDLLILDAFSADAIPTHLLTEEAFAIYLRHLAADGILAVHISNLYLDLKSVVMAAARKQGLSTELVDTDFDDEDTRSSSTWIITCRLKTQCIANKGGELTEESMDPEVQWTDDFSSLYTLIE